MNKFTTSILATTLAFACVACGGSQKNNATEAAATETPVATVMEIDDILAQADSLVNQEITFQGVCTHASYFWKLCQNIMLTVLCKHCSTKISDTTFFLLFRKKRPISCEKHKV